MPESFDRNRPSTNLNECGPRMRNSDDCPFEEEIRESNRLAKANNELLATLIEEFKEVRGAIAGRIGSPGIEERLRRLEEANTGLLPKPGIPSMDERIRKLESATEILIEKPTAPSLLTRVQKLETCTEVLVEKPNAPSLLSRVQKVETVTEVLNEKPNAPSMLARVKSLEEDKGSRVWAVRTAAGAAIGGFVVTLMNYFGVGH